MSGLIGSFKNFAHLGDLSDVEEGGTPAEDRELREDGSLELREDGSVELRDG